MGFMSVDREPHSPQRAAPARVAWRLGIALTLALVLSALLAAVAHAQSNEDELPVITISASQGSAVIGEEVEVTFTPSGPRDSDLSITIEIALRGPSVDESGTAQKFFGASDSTTSISIPIGSNEHQVPGTTITVSILGGEGYTVGSPSSVSIRIVGQPSAERQSDPQTAPNAAPTSSPVIGNTSVATATVLPGDKLRIDVHDQPENSLELGIGWISMDGSQVVLVGVIRDHILGQTYIIVRHEGSDAVVRRWIPPTSHLIYAIPWDVVNSQFSVPVHVLTAIPLDTRLPEHHMLARRFDGADDRIFAYDANLQQWRHIPNYETFLAMGFLWRNVTAADSTFFDRVSIGPPFPDLGSP